MVTQDLDGEARSFKVWAPFFECPDNSHKFFIEYLVLAFSWEVLLGEERHRANSNGFIILRYNSCGDVVGCIALDGDLLLVVKMYQYRGSCEWFLKCPEC